MADAKVMTSTGNGFQDKRIGAGVQADVLTDGDNYRNTFDLRTRLQAINSAYYTDARLNSMTVNDMQYALRSESDSAGI